MIKSSWSDQEVIQNQDKQIKLEKSHGSNQVEQLGLVKFSWLYQFDKVKVILIKLVRSNDFCSSNWLEIIN